MKRTIRLVLSLCAPLFFGLFSGCGAETDSEDVGVAGGALVLGAQGLLPSDQPPSAGRWMEDLAPIIGGKRLNELVIPGTHESGTYDLISTYLRPVDDAFAPDSNGIMQAGSFFGITDAWARAQERTIAEQLEDGIRSIDLRPCTEKDGTLRTCHGLYGPKLSDMLDDIRDFALGHPKEIVFLSLSGYSQTALGDMDAANANRVHDLVKSTLAPHLVNHAAVTPTTTFATLWSTQPGKTIIVLAGRSDAAFWSLSGKARQSWHGNVWDYGQKKRDLDNDLRNSRTESKMFFLSGAATPNENAIGLGLAPFVPGQEHAYPKSLEDLAAAVNPAMLGWALHDWSRPKGPQGAPSDAMRMNVVSIDYYHHTCLLPVVWKLDGAPNVSLAGCDILSSTWVQSPLLSTWVQSPGVWSSWRAAKACPTGFRDDGAYCYKPSPYGRGVGYPWKFGDGLSSDGMFDRCEADHGDGNCEKCLAIVYPKCADNFHAVGCNICSPDCPSGMTDIGISCQK